MALKFPNWNSLYGNLIHDRSKNLTPHAKEWFSELQGISMDQLKGGLKSLSARKNPSFPPNSMEFAQLCRLSGFNEAMNDICFYLHGPSDAKLDNQISYTLWKLLNITKGTSETIPQLEKRAKDIFLRMTHDDLVDVPVELPAPPKEPPIPMDIKLFQMLIAQNISNHNPRIWLDQVTSMKLKKLFIRERSLEIHEHWTKSNRPEVFKYISDHWVDLSMFPKSNADPLFGDYLKRLKEKENENEK